LERIDDLQCKGYRIVQDTEAFCYGIDAVLLSAFAKESVKKGSRVLDLCSGNGIIPLLIAAKTEAKEICGLEIQEEAVALARRSISLNHEEERMEMLRGDLCQIEDLRLQSGERLSHHFQIVIANPPYMKSDLQNPTSRKLIARHEVLCCFQDVARAASFALEDGGKFFLVHRPKRMAEIISILRKNKLEPKRLRTVHSYANGEAKLFLIEAVKNAGVELRILPPLVVYQDKGEYTEELNRIYGIGEEERKK